MRDQIAIMIGAGLFGLCLVATLDGYAMEQQAIFTPSGGGGIPPWQFGLILVTPGIVAVSLVILWMRYQRVFALDEGIKLTRKQVFWRTMITGAIVGAVCQAGLQGVIRYLTGMPTMWELVGMAVLVTGLASMLTYEIIRWLLFSRWKSTGKTEYKHAYEWLSLKRVTGVPMTGDDLTVFQPVDYEKTRILTDEEKEDITGEK